MSSIALKTPTLSPEQFVTRWQNAALSERAAYQQHFADVCHLIGAPTPAEMDTIGETYSFEYGMKKTSGAQGFADVFLRGHFAIEYKQQGKYKDLNEAYQQLQQYRENLNNPPLLIVCDIEHWEIHTNFTNAPPTVEKFTHAQLARPEKRNLLRRIFTDPLGFHPEQNKAQITEGVAAEFKFVVDNILEWRNEPDRVARYLTKLMFCMFVEDIGLLPRRPAYGYGILTEIVRELLAHRDGRDLFPEYVGSLFRKMATGGSFERLDIPYFNGSMFVVDDTDIFRLDSTALQALNRATDRQWAHVEPTIFGTIFERTLDAAKRAQLGAHYTSPDDIRLIVEPVLMQPLRRAWEAALEQAAPIRERWQTAPHPAARHAAEAELIAIRSRILDQVRSITVLDPACGSGNFLYISLQQLLNLEKEIITHLYWTGLKPEETIKVHPRQLYGMEINKIAHALASVVVWIGYLQWRQDNGFFEVEVPILSDLSGNIRRMDAILTYDADGTPREPDWHAADVIVGNPPFLGGNRIRAELGSSVDKLFALYRGRVPATADLVTYWFEKARAQIEAGKSKRAGLLSTNSIRGGVNRDVLERIKQTGDIFMAWSDRAWVLDGAAVRVSMVGFDNGTETVKMLNGITTEAINPDLTASVNLTNAAQLQENLHICYIGTKKAGAFDISETIAKQFLDEARDNAKVVLEWLNGEGIVKRLPKKWIIYFGEDDEELSAKYVAPFDYVRKHVYAERQKNNEQRARVKWWQHRRPAVEMREATSKLTRYIATPRVSKHRLFVWVRPNVLPDDGVYVFARDDDYFFGVLHSRAHELWSLRMGTWLGKGNDPRYTPTTTFETFPLPFAPKTEDFTDPRVQAISAAAKQLDEERGAWLNPDAKTPSPHGEGVGGEVKNLSDRTLTNLYNALVAHRAGEKSKSLKASAVEFAPRLAALHDALDRAVLAAYGWTDNPSDDELLSRLLALNRARSGRQSSDTPSDAQPDAQPDAL